MALRKASGNQEIKLSQKQLEELSFGLFCLTSSVLKMRMRERSVGRPLPGSGELSPKRIKEERAKQMNLFDLDLDGQGGGATTDDAC